MNAKIIPTIQPATATPPSDTCTLATAALPRRPDDAITSNQDSSVDCIIIGYNDRKFSSLWNEAQGSDHKRRALSLESVVYEGERVFYDVLFNHYVAKQTGKDSNFSTCRLPNLALAYLYSYLNKRGLNIEFVNLFSEDKEHLASLLSKRPKSVAITTTLYTDSAPIVEIVRFVRQHNPDTKIIVGGPHIYNLCSLYGSRPKLLNAALAEIGADVYVNDSQGELALSRILRELKQADSPDFGSIANLLFKKGDSLCQTARELEDNDLDENAVDWGTFDPSFLGPVVPVRTARSCAFKCAFCNYPYFAGPLKLTSLHTVEEELGQLANAGVQSIIFIDDTFNIPLPRFKRICQLMIDRQYNFDWYSYFRCSNADDEAFDLMEKSGCKAVFLGIESGDQAILNNMNKAVKIDQYRYGIRKLKEHNIMTFASFIMGFPGETRETALNTLNFIEETAPTFYRVMPYFHYLTTPVARQADKYEIRGSGYDWQHRTMDSTEAFDLASMAYQTVTTSVVIPTPSFDFWGIPYLLGNGVSPNQLMDFLEYAQSLMLQGIEARIE